MITQLTRHSNTDRLEKKEDTIEYYDMGDNGELVLSRKETFKLPFDNLYDMVHRYSSIAKEGNDDDILWFAETHYKMYFHFLNSMYLNSLDPVEVEWVDVDEQKMKALLHDSFFSSYPSLDEETRNKFSSLPDIKLNCCIFGKNYGPKKVVEYNRVFPFLEIYAYLKLQISLLDVLPDDYEYDVKIIWLWHDFIEQIYDMGFIDLIADVYEAKGIQWFVWQGDDDPVMYDWACLAVCACKKTGRIEDSRLKNDLVNIFSQMTLAFSARNTLDENKAHIAKVRDAIINFDQEHIEQLAIATKNLEHEKIALEKENKNLRESINLLKKEISQIQGSQEIDEDEKLKQMMYRIDAVNQENTAIDSRHEKLSSIWDKLDTQSKKDLKVSYSLINELECIDLAILPILRTIEREMGKNFIGPYRQSKLFKNAANSYSTSGTYLETEKCLKNCDMYPTLGNYPFIGKYLGSDTAVKSSKLIGSLAKFLGDKKEKFIEISNQLNNYKVGIKKIKVIDVRNGIAHGKEFIISNLDQNCYDDICKLVYDPPIRILCSIIENSLK